MHVFFLTQKKVTLATYFFISLYIFFLCFRLLMVVYYCISLFTLVTIMITITILYFSHHVNPSFLQLASYHLIVFFSKRTILMNRSLSHVLSPRSPAGFSSSPHLSRVFRISRSKSFVLPTRFRLRADGCPL